MSGRRFTDWSHVRVTGDREQAAQHLPTARKVLGFVVDEAARNNLPTFKHSINLDDGTIITAELAAGIPRIHIDVSGEDEPERPRREFEDLVTWARTDEAPDGIAEDYPEQILRPEWRTFFYSSDTPGFEAFERAKGTYRLDADGSDLFPEGVRLAGNVDWVNEKRERVSWRGPNLRYFYDPYVLPATLYGRRVYHMGRALLDLDAYEAANDVSLPRYVLGAAIGRPGVGTWLYVVLADIPDPEIPATFPAGYAVTIPFPSGACDHYLLRFRLDPDDSIGLPGLRVRDESHEEVWSLFGIQGGVNPYLFNASATKACAVLFNGLGQGGSPVVFGATYNHFSRAGSGEVNFAFQGLGPESFTFNPIPQQVDVLLTLDIDEDEAQSTLEPIGLQPGGPRIAAMDFIGDEPAPLLIRRSPAPMRVPEDGLFDPYQPAYEVMAIQFNCGGTVWDYVHGFIGQIDSTINVPSYDLSAGFLWKLDVRNGTVIDFRYRSEVELGTVQQRARAFDARTREDATGYATDFPSGTYAGRTLAWHPRLVFASATQAMASLSISSVLYSNIVFLFPQPSFFADSGVPIGCALGMAEHPYPSETIFGGFRFSGTSGPPQLLFSSLSLNAPTVRPYADGGHCFSACELSGDIMVLSHIRPDQPDQCINYVTRDELPDLTGLGGEGASYYPLWTLGTPPAP